MGSSALQDENNDALDWVNEEEDIRFWGGGRGRDDSDPDSEEGGEDEDSEVEAPVSAGNARSRADARPAVPVDFPREVPPFEPFRHPQQPHERRILLPSDFWDSCCYVLFLRQKNSDPEIQDILQRSPYNGKVRRTAFCSLCQVPLCKEF